MRYIVYGAGATGARVARNLVSQPDTTDVVIIEVRPQRRAEVVGSLGEPSRGADIDGVRTETRMEKFRALCRSADAAILTATEDHVGLAEVALTSGLHVVSVSDDSEVVESLIDLDSLARQNQRNLVVGAGFSPGLSCVLARHAARQLDSIDEIHIAKFGTGGPACARQHHRALRTEGVDWHNQRWQTRRASSGRELCWFPDPVGGLDCYQADLVDVKLILPVFPDLMRATARVAATRRDRFTRWLPMMRRPHPEGLVGAVRVEVRGWRNGTREAVVLGVLDRPAVAAGMVAATTAKLCVENRLSRPGAGGLAELVPDSIQFLALLAESGVKAAVFEGSAT